MAKYINVDSLVVAYSGHTPDDEFSKGVDFVLDLLDSKPPADVRPVIRGCWINEERVGFGSVEAECSNCGRRMIYNPAWICCPWCMADMRGGDAE